MNVYALRRPSVPILEDLTDIPLILHNFMINLTKYFFLRNDHVDVLLLIINDVFIWFLQNFKNK